MVYIQNNLQNRSWQKWYHWIPLVLCCLCISILPWIRAWILSSWAPHEEGHRGKALSIRQYINLLSVVYYSYILHGYYSYSTLQFPWFLQAHPCYQGQDTGYVLFSVFLSITYKFKLILPRAMHGDGEMDTTIW